MYYLELMVFSEQSVILLSQTFGLSPHCLNISIRLTNSYTHIHALNDYKFGLHIINAFQNVSIVQPYDQETSLSTCSANVGAAFH